MGTYVFVGDQSRHVIDDVSDVSLHVDRIFAANFENLLQK
jgi:hypothetical protein